MILFLEDWEKEENSGPEGLGPIVDFNTRNKSFLEYASLLQQMGIRNWAFVLALHDPKLQGVDPMSENLTDEQKYRIGIELTVNPWYYLREVAKVPPKAGADPVDFRAHRANIGMFWLFMNCVSFFLLQPRQTGKSVVADMINNYLLHYRTFNTRTILVTLSQTLLVENIERIKHMRELLPQFTIAVTDQDTKAKEAYTYPARGNALITKVSQNSERGSTKLGRGCSTAIQQFDEAAFIDYMDIVWAAAVPATGAAYDLAIERGEPYGRMITTTAGDKMSRSGKFMYEIYESSADWTEHYFDLTDKEELHKVIRKNSKDGDLLVGATFNHLQLGFSDDWLAEKIRQMKNVDVDQINRDYFNVWTSGSSLSPLPPEITQDIMMSEKNPDHIQITSSGYIVKWYIPNGNIKKYMSENHIVIGADTSEAINRDATSFVGVNIATLETVFTISVSEADVIKLADFIVDLMVTFERTTLIIEHKSTAGTFIETLYTKLPLHDIDPFRRIYNTIVQEKDKNPDLFKVVTDRHTRRDSRFYTQNKKKFGFNQTANTRHLLYKEVLQLSAKRCRNIIYDKTLSSEMRSLEIDERTGRIDHSSNGHDDNVMAWLLAMWFLMYGKNLTYYGIDTKRVMFSIQENGVLLDDTESREKALIESYEKELEELIIKLVDNDNSIYKVVLEHKVKQIKTKLERFNIEVKNIDNMIRDVKAKRNEKMFKKFKI